MAARDPTRGMFVRNVCRSYSGVVHQTNSQEVEAESPPCHSGSSGSRKATAASPEARRPASASRHGTGAADHHAERRIALPLPHQQRRRLSTPRARPAQCLQPASALQVTGCIAPALSKNMTSDRTESAVQTTVHGTSVRLSWRDMHMLYS
jgi:hypothetical protein